MNKKTVAVLKGVAFVAVGAGAGFALYMLGSYAIPKITGYSPGKTAARLPQSGSGGSAMAPATGADAAPQVASAPTTTDAAGRPAASAVLPSTDNGVS